MKRPGNLGDDAPMKAKAARADEVQAAIQNLTSPGASELSKAKPEKIEEDRALKEAVVRKADFPPGLVVSEQAKQKMNQHKNKAQELSEEKKQKKAAQLQRWLQRHDVLQKWEKMTAKHEQQKKELLNKWAEQDARRAAQRQRVLDQLVASNASPAAIEAHKQRIAQEDTLEALSRANEMTKLEEHQLKEVEKREKAQVQQDKMYNFFAGVLGWQKRQIPLVVT